MTSRRLHATQPGAAQTKPDRTSGTVTLGCGGLEGISSTGLGVLPKKRKRLAAGAGRLTVAGGNRPLQDIVEFSGFDQVLDIEQAR